MRFTILALAVVIVSSATQFPDITWVNASRETAAASASAAAVPGRHAARAAANIAAPWL